MMPPQESAALVAERLPRVLAKASGLKWRDLDLEQRGVLAQDATALLYELTQARLVLLPLAAISGEEAMTVPATIRLVGGVNASD